MPKAKEKSARLNDSEIEAILEYSGDELLEVDVECDPDSEYEEESEVSDGSSNEEEERNASENEEAGTSSTVVGDGNSNRRIECSLSWKENNFQVPIFPFLGQ